MSRLLELRILTKNIFTFQDFIIEMLCLKKLCLFIIGIIVRILGTSLQVNACKATSIKNINKHGTKEGGASASNIVQNIFCTCEFYQYFQIDLFVQNQDIIKHFGTIISGII